MSISKWFIYYSEFEIKIQMACSSKHQKESMRKDEDHWVPSGGKIYKLYDFANVKLMKIYHHHHGVIK